MPKGDKHWPNTWTEVEDLGNRKFGATISVGHRVFFDKADGNKPKRHKLTDNRPDYVLIQGAKCCVEVYLYYAKYFDVQHEEVRLYEERWVVQRWRDPPGKWEDIGAWNPVVSVEEYSELAGDVVKVTVTYDTDYGVLTVEYFQRDGNNLKHNVSFKNTSGSTETFRVVQKWAGIVGAKCNGKDAPVAEDVPFLAFHQADKPSKKFTIAENLSSMIFNEDGSEKTDHCLQRPISIETHANGMKADFIYGDWVLARNESLVIDPDTATLDNPTEDGLLYTLGNSAVSFAAAAAACPTGSLTRDNTSEYIAFGGIAYESSYWSYAYRAYVEWDISALAGATIDANPAFKYHGWLDSSTAEEINPISAQPSVAADADLWADIASGTAYVDPFAFATGTGQSVDLGASAKTDLQTAVTAEQSWFAIGIQSPDDECPASATSPLGYIYSEEKTDAANPKPTLYITYTAAAGEDYPISTSCNLSLTASIDRDIAWDRAVSLNLSLTTSVDRAVAYARAISSNLSLAVNIVIQKSWNIATSTALSLATSISRAIAYARATSSNLSLTATISRILAFNKATSTALSLATSISKAWGRLRTTSSNLSLATTVSRAVTYTRATSSNLSLSTSVSRVLAFKKAISLGLALATTVVKSWGRTITSSASLSLSTAVSRTVAYSRATSSNLSLAVTVVRTQAFNRVISVGLSLLTNVSRVVAYTRATSSALSLAVTVAWWTKVVALTLKVRSMALTLQHRVFALTLRFRSFSLTLPWRKTR